MGLQEARAFLHRAVARSTSNGQPAQYVVHAGVMYAQSAAVLAGYPVPHMRGTFGLAASELDAALTRMKDEPMVEPAEGALALKCGRLKSTIDLFAAEPPAGMLEDDLAWIEPPTSLVKAITTVLPFVSSEGTWQRSVELKPGLVRAVSAQHACLVEVDGLKVDGPLALTDDAATYLSELSIEPDGWVRLDSALGFKWPSGAWARCQLSAREWPTVVENVFERSTADCPVLVTDEWREAFADCNALGEGVVDLSPDKMVARSPHGIHEQQFRLGVTRETRWALKTLANVLAVAQAWDPDASGGPAAFRGAALRGVAMGMSR